MASPLAMRYDGSLLLCVSFMLTRTARSHAGPTIWQPSFVNIYQTSFVEVVRRFIIYCPTRKAIKFFFLKK